MYLQDITAHVQLSEGFSQTLGLHDDLVEHLGTGEVKVQHFVGIFSMEVAVSQNPTFFQTVPK